jgi:hypothetical protein
VNIKKLKLLALAVLVVMSCNLSPVNTDATATQVAVELFATQTQVALGVSGTQTALVPTIAPTFTTAPTETPTQIPPPTDTVVPEITDTPAVISTPVDPPDGEPEVIIFDDFSNPDEAIWVAEELSDPSLESITVVDGRALLESAYFTEDFFGIAQITYHDLPQDFAVTVEIEFTAGSSEIGEAGIIIRLTPDFAADYEFTITPIGEFAIYKYTDEFDELVGYTQHNAIRTEPGAVNQLTVLANGDEMTLLINGVEIVSVTDDDIHGAWLGLIVYNFDEIGTGAYFDNLLITNLAAYLADPPPVP